MEAAVRYTKQAAGAGALLALFANEYVSHSFDAKENEKKTSDL
jgi:hypothetical protein